RATAAGGAAPSCLPVIARTSVGPLCRMIRSTVDRRMRSRSAPCDGLDSVSATTRILSPGEECIQRQRRLGRGSLHARCTIALRCARRARPSTPFGATLAGVSRRHAGCRCRFGMTISSLLTPELVLPALHAQAKAQVLETLAAHVGLVHPHVDARRLADALHERERQSTTALEDGVAIPHVRLAGLPGPLAALARSTAGIACGA